MDISKIDKNFKIKTKINKTDIRFYDVKNPPFEVSGVFYENGTYRRIPEDVAIATSTGVKALHTNTAGGRVRFRTNSSYIAINAKMYGLGKMSHFAFSGSIGFDLYIKSNGEDVYKGTFIPPLDIIDEYEGIIDLGSTEEKEITLNMPLYSNVKELYIGLNENAELQKIKPYKISKPIVFYGSSITQGGCASRPGMSYENIISREIGCDYVNLGFSGNAMGEDAIAKYIADMDMSLFVYDYDYNSPTLEHLKSTHQRMFEIIRKKNPELPILLLSRPKYRLNEEEEKRFSIIRQTYDNAVNSGDKNVYILKGTKLMEMAKSDGTVDNCHPTDFGFSSMATALIPVIKEILQKGE